MITIKTDSRKVKKGDTFVALKGINSNGDIYIEKAIENGASRIVCEKGSYSVETLNVDNPREYLLNELKLLYHSYLESMTIIGITGTNGKTTSAYLLSELLNRSGNKSAYIGTIGFYIGMERKAILNNTTPDICDLYELLLDAYDENCQYVVLEVSSQGLSYGRLEGVPFDCAIFTNLTQDHLDYHKTMENYALAKQKLFEYLPKNGLAIINDDDAYKEYYLLPKNHNITYGFEEADYQILDYEMTSKGSNFIMKKQEQEFHFHTSLLGKHNVYNVLVTIILLLEENIDVNKIQEIIPSLKAPSGRMDTIFYDTNRIIIDYAHTPDAVGNILKAVKELKPNHIYTIVGCGGNRDKTKRPEMAKMATNLSTLAIFTSDNPRLEDPNDILDDMINNLENTNYEVIVNRKNAIIKGIQMLENNDILLVLGKGHETYQIIGKEKLEFDDKQIVLEII